MTSFFIISNIKQDVYLLWRKEWIFHGRNVGYTLLEELPHAQEMWPLCSGNSPSPPSGVNRTVDLNHLLLSPPPRWQKSQVSTSICWPSVTPVTSLLSARGARRLSLKLILKNTTPRITAAVSVFSLRSNYRARVRGARANEETLCASLSSYAPLQFALYISVFVCSVLVQTNVNGL